MKSFHLSLICAASALLSTSSTAEVVTLDAKVSTTSSYSNTMVELPRFESSLGTLTGVRIEVHLQSQGSIGYENLSKNLTEVSTRFGSAFTLSDTSGTTLAQSASTIEAKRIVEGFDGRLDFEGPSGLTDLGLSTQASAVFEGPADSTWVEGILPSAPPLELSLEMFDLTQVDALGRSVVRRGQVNEAVVEVSYIYTPNGIGDDD